MTGPDLWLHLFNQYNAHYWHWQEHHCDPSRCPDAPKQNDSTEAYAELVANAPTTDGDVIPAGTLIRVVMVSRLGDLGITRDLDRVHGYETRVPPEQLANCRLTREVSSE